MWWVLGAASLRPSHLTPTPVTAANFMLEAPSPPPDLAIHCQGSEEPAFSHTQAKVCDSERTQADSANGEGTGAKSGGNEPFVSQSPFPVETHRMHFVPPVVSS